nr:uncharacterized protein LOC123771037 [Procambarus clarkii]XP_045619379.1 uncharacterized protein LOC123771037 [Procambarus clarkii]XP_045619471.1 uncharacterized protein LOC123771037 [Procambarus clarkii]XP_045619564.1 uncharacterized protein LOC123771037 [Procambarus clarkii]XP_045619630.1 uncharacterized protein LOC123771037 [Procambarus clarkii]XP_045619706.1 uncharacterized protein LOC123771037 [Procambarus clarkii]XP_045619787.1 uncharacterized protein LOC123771037 [Procambarus clarki
MDWTAARLLVLVWATTTLAQHDCMVSRSIKVKWVWSPLEVMAWVPHDISPDTPILQFEVTFAGYPSVARYTLIQIYVNSTNVTLHQNVPENYVLKNTKSFVPGWINISIFIHKNITVMNAGNKKPLSSQPVHLPVEQVLISGSNVTINCETGRMLWHIMGRREVIPLGENLVGENVTVYSNHQHILPSLTLEGKTLILGWENHTISTTTRNPLPPYIKHQLFIRYLYHSNGGLICKIESDSGVLATLPLQSRPVFLVMDSLDQNPFFLLQHIAASNIVAQPQHDVSPELKTLTRPPSADSTPPSTDSNNSDLSKLSGWSGWWVFVAVLLAIMLVFVIIMCIVSHYHRPKLEKYLGGMNFITEAIQEDVEIQLQPARRPLLMRSVSHINTEDPKSAAPLRLWNAVASGEQEEVEQVLATLSPSPQVTLDGWDTSPYEESHRRGHSNVLRVLEAFMNKRPDVPHNDMILGVLQAHTKKVDAVFAAASGGQYRYAGGVDVLLRAYSLPGTILDQQGRSLLHYAASVMLADVGPLWLAPDIRSMVESHGVYVNAVDFNGCTALHVLAETANVSERNTCWDGKALSVKEAWVNLANLIMSLGCDPRLPNHRNKYPHQVARESGNAHLANQLAKAVGNLGIFSTAESIVKFKDFIEASRTGNIIIMKELLMKGVRVLPLGSRKDPLLEAILGGHRDAVFLLLSAGAPLCAHGLVGNTPFEAAHSTVGLPALFPALIRKAFCDRLQAEIDMIPGSDNLQNIMKDGMSYLKTIAEISGHRLGEELSTWLDCWPTSTSVNYTDMLALAAASGLTLTCQLLGVAGVSLNPLPNHLHPLVQALENNHHDTVYSLCRDLKMNPYSTKCDLNKVSEQLINDLLESELEKFERKLRKKEIGDSATKDLLDYAKGITVGQTDKQIRTFLYLLAELSLVTVFHRTRRINTSLDINGVVHQASGSTMLHIAAAYGKINMVEYLLSQGASHTCMTSGGLTAAHLAAVRGHKECMDYMVEYTGSAMECSIGLKPSVMLEHFNENVKRCHLDLLSSKEVSLISNAKGDHAKAKLILTGRSHKLGILTPTTLQDNLLQEDKKMEGIISKEFESSVQHEVHILFDNIKKVDARFSGKVLSYTPLTEKIEFFLPDNFEFYLELDDYNALKDGCITIKEMERNEIKNGEYLLGISSSRDQMLFTGANFRNLFCKAAHEALITTSFKGLALIPPFLAHTSTGACVYVAYREKQITLLLRLMLTPVLKVPCPQGLQLHKLPKRFQNHLQSYTYEHIANTSEGNWMYMCNFAHKCIIAGLREDEHIVLQACCYFAKLLSTCWWLPKQEQRHHGRSWQLYPVGINVPSLRTLKSLFLEELIEQEELLWSKEHFIERIISILRRGSYPGKITGSFTSPPQWDPKLSGGIQATIQFLQNLQKKYHDKLKINNIFSK